MQIGDVKTPENWRRQNGRKTSSWIGKLINRIACRLATSKRQEIGDVKTPGKVPAGSADCKGHLYLYLPEKTQVENTEMTAVPPWGASPAANLPSC